MAVSDTRRLIAVQGLGAGAITSSVQIILSDLVTLQERGTFSGLMAVLVTFSRFVRSIHSDSPRPALGHSAVVLVQSLGDHWPSVGTGMPSFPHRSFLPLQLLLT